MPHRAVLVGLALFALGCRRPGPPAGASASASARPAVLPAPSAEVSPGEPLPRARDARFGAWFPERAQGFHLDANADQRLFGTKAPLPLRDAAELVAVDADRLEPA